jgi:hypothetical protein
MHACIIRVIAAHFVDANMIILLMFPLLIIIGFTLFDACMTIGITALSKFWIFI